MPNETLLAQTLVELADTLVDEFDVVELLTLLTNRCVEVLDVSAAGLMLAATEGDLQMMASSSVATEELERYELKVQEGPCLDCYRTGEPVGDENLAGADGPWPRFAAHALAAGFCSVHALPLRLRGTIIGALDLFNLDPGELSRTDLAAAQAFADVATIAILQHRAVLEAHVVNKQLNFVLNSRMVVEQATGMVAERRGVSMAKAFATLRSYARSNEVPLVEVAQDVIHGTLAEHRLDRRTSGSASQP